MADIKWSAFPNDGTLQTGDIVVGIRAGVNAQFVVPALFGTNVAVVTGTSQIMISNFIYIANNGSLITFALPTTANIGDILCVVGQGAGGWTITQGSSQQIRVGSNATTITTGSVSSTNQSDALYLICITANSLWTTFCGPQGNLTIV